MLRFFRFTVTSRLSSTSTYFYFYLLLSQSGRDTFHNGSVECGDSISRLKSRMPFGGATEALKTLLYIYKHTHTQTATFLDNQPSLQRMDQKERWEANGMATVAPPALIWYTGVVFFSARRFSLLLSWNFYNLVDFLHGVGDLGRAMHAFWEDERVRPVDMYIHGLDGWSVRFKTHSTRLRWMGSRRRRAYGKCPTGCIARNKQTRCSSPSTS
ncbi:hypothetical protein BDP55DRAFT_427211 [Colletotrichum godetiae]|uniref:Uncharacterized protein n=1 Tax=Colletotrichum godetiae TaxID=1209918 RepID=A0AAJ0ASX4_9PEZI|nr:uncharacterized protein BDP55DRAFT_427211 [Colletotrichum godetiae]KAK1689042.1 hypothetical protein BDP55DRAFT_427211 [Colletotrichum godetiae]